MRRSVGGWRNNEKRYNEIEEMEEVQSAWREDVKWVIEVEMKEQENGFERGEERKEDGADWRETEYYLGSVQTEPNRS